MFLSEQEIRGRLSAVRLPTMPQLLVKLMEQCQDEKAGLPDLANLVSQDAGMTAKVLRVAQSPAFRRSGSRLGLEQAMMSLGLDMIRTLVISESIYSTFNGFSASSRVDLRAFWKHSLIAAVIARQAAKAMKYPNIDEAYIAGLLHDIGRLALLTVAPREYAVHFHAPANDKLCAAEQRTLQMPHTEAGAWVVEQWRLDSFLADSVLYHHEPASRVADAHPLIRIVWMAHCLACSISDEAAVETAISVCGISRSDVSAIIASVPDTVEQAAKFLGIDLGGLDNLVPPDTTPKPDAPAQLGGEIQQMLHASELGRFFSGFQDQERLVKAICGTACSEFTFGTACLLLRDEDKNILVTHPVGESQQRLSGYAVPLGKPGPIAEAGLQNRLSIVAPDDAMNGIAEEQLLRILDAERLTCVPLCVSGSCKGVLVAGIDAAHVAEIRSQERMLQSFGAQAASALGNLGARIRADQARTAELEQQFREASKKVAHEVNNPLAILKNYLRVLDRKLSKKEPVADEMSILDEELNRIGQIVNSFADQAASPANATADINRCIEHVVQLFSGSGFAKLVRIYASTYEGADPAACHDGKLKQILVNLVKNAAEAMPQGGEIILSNEGLVVRDDRRYVGITVKDTGPGIPSSILANIFSPVASTKGEGHRGLGLSIVHDLVKEAGGKITCHSGPKGTLFELLVPASGHAEKQRAGYSS